MFSMEKHFLQSAEWQKFQQAQGKEVFVESKESWSYIACIEESDTRLVGGKRVYVPYGPSFKTIDGLAEALKSLKKLAIKHKALYVRVEPFGSVPSEQLKRLGLIKAEKSTQPELTWQINLKSSETDILKGMSSTNRNLWNTAGKKGLRFETTYDLKKLDIFLDMIHDMANRTGMRPHDDKYFKLMAESLFDTKSAGLAFGYLDKKPIVGSMFFDDKKAKTRYYAHAGSFGEARKLQANSPLLCYLIFDAKKKGFEVFDFYGVAPIDRTNHPWAGFSKFKRSFGGYEKKFNGTWELPVNKIKYRAFKTSRILVNKLR